MRSTEVASSPRRADARRGPRAEGIRPSPDGGPLGRRWERVCGINGRVARVPWCGSEVYEAAEAFAERCLLRDDSLFTPGRRVATLEHAEALQATVGVEDRSEGTFAGKLV